MEKLFVEPRLRRAWLAIGYGLIVLGVGISVLPNVPLDVPIRAEDKVAHVLGYAAVMWWFAQAYRHHVPRVVIAIVLVCLGLALEIVQWLEPERTLTWGDLVANAAGVALGWLLAPPRLPNVLEKIDARRRHQ